MAIKAIAGQVVLTLTNAGRETANPPIKFVDLNHNNDPGQPPLSTFAYSFMVKASSHIPAEIIHINGTEGSYIQVTSYNGSWYFSSRSVSLSFGAIDIGPVTLNTWTQFLITNNGPFFDIYMGEETGAGSIAVTLRRGQQYPLQFPFSDLQIFISSHISVCNFKYWDELPSISELESQITRWDWDGTPTPMWASTLRTPGDISNIANPYTSFEWGDGHAYTTIDNPSNLVFDSVDPINLADTKVCPAWVYPVIPTAEIDVNPGITPPLPTIYKGAPFFQFDDRGSVPINTAFTSIMYYGLPYKDGGPADPRPGPSDTYGLYKDSTGIEVATLTNRFEDTTGVTLPPGLQSSNMYDWVYSAQFRYQPPAGETTGQAHIGFIYLYVRYIGRPRGTSFPHVPGVPPVEPPPPGPGEPPPPGPQPVAMSGLFAISKTATTDKYGATIELKIPNPTIRTAYIGE